MDKMDRQERLERTASMAYNKGLINNPGENNCFLNSAVQVLWHLDVFRRSFREIKGHYCMGQSCIFCALDFIFKQFQYSSNDALPPDGLRVALAVAFKNQHRFQLGDMDDAAECFENILSHMHTLVARNEHDDACTAKHCISHQKFAMQIIEQTICQCGEQSEPLPFFQLVHYVSASALCTKARSLKGWDNTRPIEKQFGVLLRRAGQDTRECQSPDCRDRVQVQRLLLNCPDIVSVGLIWDSESPDAEHIADVLQCIGTTLKLSDLYHQVYDERAKEASLQLVGIVTYYGKHYSTFFFHSKLRTWIYFDDARVKEIGPDWSVMMEKCRLCHYQPLLLLYANPSGTPISAESAPKETILINGMVRKKDAHHSSKRVMSDSREAGDGVSDGEKSPVGSKKGRLRSKGKDEKRSLKSKKSLSSSDLTEPSKYLFRTPSNASDSGATSPRKEKHRPSFKRIGNAIMNVVNPALAVSHLKQGKKKNSHKASRRSSTGSGSESSGENDLIDLSSKNEAAKMEILKLYEQSKALNAAQVGAVNHDSGISSAPSSAGESVSSTDTNHGGSDEDLIDFNQSWRNSRYDNWPPVHPNDRIEIFLQQAGNYLAESESFETHKDFVSALSYCSEAASLYRRVVEEPGVDMKTKHFASTRRNACMARARNLRLFVQSPHDNRNTSVSLSKQREEELLHQQRQRDHMIMRQQQQFQQQVPPPQYTSLQRRDRFVSDKPVPQVGLQRVVEVPVYSSSQNGGQDRNYADEQYVASTYPLKVKAKPIVYSSGHYVSKAQQDKLGSGRVASGVCSQQIKPDSMCYNPVHYDRESEIAARIQNININSPRPKTNEEYTTVISVGDNRPKISENRHSRPSPVEQRRESSAVYISPSNSSNSRTVPTASFNPTVYRSNGTQSPPTITAVRPRPKVFYAGNSALGTNSSTRDRSLSPARSVDELDYIHSNRGAYGPRPRDYVPAPPYNSIHQREQLKSYSTSSLSKPRWYHNSPEDSVANNSRDFRPVSARVITDRPVCEKCRCIPIDRRQRLCAGCQQEVRQMHSNTARFY